MGGITASRLSPSRRIFANSDRRQLSIDTWESKTRVGLGDKKRVFNSWNSRENLLENHPDVFTWTTIKRWRWIGKTYCTMESHSIDFSLIILIRQRNLPVGAIINMIFKKNINDAFYERKNNLLPLPSRESTPLGLKKGGVFRLSSKVNPPDYFGSLDLSSIEWESLPSHLHLSHY